MGLREKIAGDRKKDSVLWLAPLPLKEAKKAVEDQQRQPEGVSEGWQSTDPQEACKACRHRSREPDRRVAILVFSHEPLDQSCHFLASLFDFLQVKSSASSSTRAARFLHTTK